MAKTVNRTLKININDKEIDNSISKINKEIRQLRKNLAAANNPADRAKYNAELKKAYQYRRDINNELAETKTLMQKVKGQIGPIGTLMAGAFSIGLITNFAGQVIDTIKLFRELKQETKLLTGLQGALLDQATAKTKALADTFETDYKENLIAANALSKQFNVSYDEALQTMEKGYLAGANVSGDMLNQLKEYAPLMKEANIPLEEMVALIAQTEKEGIFNDKGIDAIKEGMLAIREGTKATREALDGIGIDSTKLYDDLQDGTISYIDAIKQVSTQLNTLESQSPEVGTAIADIFKGAGEDAGLQYLQSIKDIDLELNNLIDTTDAYTILKEREIEVNERLNNTWTSLTETGGFFNNIMVTTKELLADVLGGFDSIPERLSRLNARNAQDQQNLNIEEFRAHMARMKEALGDRYNYEELKANYIGNIHDQNIKAQLTGLQDVVVKTKTTTDKKVQIERDAAQKKAEREAEREQKAAEREAAKQQRRLEKLRENEAAYEAEQIRLKQESQQRADELEEENRLEKEAQRLEREALAAETEEERIQLFLEREQWIALQVLEIEKNRDIERAKAANATEAELFAIKQKYALAADKVNLNASQDKKNLQQQEVKWTDYTENQKFNLVRSGLGSAAELFNKQSAAYKALKISETTVATVQAAINAYQSAAQIPYVGYVLGPLAAAAALKFGFEQVQAIKNEPVQRAPSYYAGGPTHTSGDAGIDGLGGRHAIVHPNEYMIPAFVAQDNSDPNIPPIMKYLEAKRTGDVYLEGGATSDNVVPDTIDVATPENTQLNSTLLRIEQALVNPQPAIAYFDNAEAEKVKNYQTEVEQARNGAIVR